MQAELWYLNHSGFAVRTASHLLVFDDCTTPSATGKFEEGLVETEALKASKPVFFASHSHGDHFSRQIFHWKTVCPDCRYVLSDDIASKENALYVRPGGIYELDGMEIRTFTSTDLGVAFLVKADGLTIYHAGDLNWWHWEGDLPENNRAMAEAYRTEIDSLKGTSIDVAFVPVDPRLKDQALWGVDYFMRTVGAKLCIPMHFWDDFNSLKRLETDPVTAPYREQLAKLCRCGQKFTV